MSNGDRPYFFIAPPPTIPSFNQETFGIIEIDACGRTALKCNGDILMDGKITNMQANAPQLYFDGSIVNVSGATFFHSGARFMNVNTSDALSGLPYSASQPQLVSAPWSVSGTLYVSSVAAADGNGNVKVLCVA